MAMIPSPLARRLVEIRRETYGGDGVPRLAERLGIPARTWQNYEAGVVIPGPILLEYIAVTGASPGWLLTGQGDRFLGAPEGRRAM